MFVNKHEKRFLPGHFLADSERFISIWLHHTLCASKQHMLITINRHSNILTFKPFLLVILSAIRLFSLVDYWVVSRIHYFSPSDFSSAHSVSFAYKALSVITFF